MDEYLIGDLLLRVPECGIEFFYGHYMEKFRYKGSKSYETIQLSGYVRSLLTYLDNPIGKDNGVYQPFLAEGQRVLVYHWGCLRYAFAVIPEEFTVVFDVRMVEQVPLNTDWFFGVCSLHRQLLKHGATILHASYIDWNDNAILFAAPSQTGKSTQAFLWEQYMGAQIINGDRVLLRQRGEKWFAYGFPCCGSSDICVNRTILLTAVVVLEQGTENHVESMTSMEKIKALITGMEFYHWDQSEMDIIVQLASLLVQQIPIIRLVCRPDADAVYCLKNYLESEGLV